MPNIKHLTLKLLKMKDARGRKFYAYAERTFEGRVDILTPAALHRLDDKRVLIATVRIPAPIHQSSTVCRQK